MSGVVCVVCPFADDEKLKNILPIQEESGERNIPVGQLVTKLLVSRESPLPPCRRWPGIDSPVPWH